MENKETIQQKEKRLRSLYRETFRQESDYVVLFDILNECGFFSQHVSGESDLVKQNLARFILYRLGAWQEVNGLDVVKALIKLPPERN